MDSHKKYATTGDAAGAVQIAALANIIDRLQTEAAAVSSAGDRLQRIVTRAFGEGFPAEVQGKAPEPTGAVSVIQGLIDQIQTDHRAIESLADRLDGLV